jgi:hypothetical protein
MTALSESVQKAIKDGLPGMVAGELSDFITQAERTARALEEAKQRIKTLEETNEQQREALNKHAAYEVRERELAKIAAEQRETELTLLRREAQLDAKIAQAELAGVKDTQAAFLRNVTVRQTVISDASKSVAGSAGGNGYTGTPGYLARNSDGRPDTTTSTQEQE